MRLSVVCFLLIACGSDATTDDTVRIDTGDVQGTVYSQTRSFLGIPFAAPPTGSLRFAPPAAPAPWSKPLVAKKFKPTCPQPSNPLTTNLTYDENCLTLNVWTPLPAPKNAPVMLFLHGGAFVVGAGGDAMYDGTSLAEHGVIVVTANYRLGALGFLNGNWGIQDQRAALQWVQRNIAAFGGNPHDVTLFGESAGAISVLVHLVSPPSAGLFQRAIVESGPIQSIPNRSFFWQDMSAAQAHGQMFMQPFGCADLDCMRGKSADDIVAALSISAYNLRGLAMQRPWWPIVDGTDIPAPPYTLIQQGAFARVPVIIGTNRDEGTLFERILTPVTTQADYDGEAMAAFGAQGPNVVAHYPASAFPSVGDAASAMFGDSAFTCDTRRVARALATAGVPVWRYHFEHVPDMPLFPGIGVHHAAELAFVFENRFMASTEAPFGQQIEGWWTSFAKSSDPGSDWPAYDGASDRYLAIDVTPHVEQGLTKDLCDFWDTLPPAQ